MISAQQLETALTTAGIPPGRILIFDEDYELPEPSWVTGELGASLREFLFNARVQFVNEQFDCNKFAKMASTIADVCWARTRREEAALAFGMFATVGHMLCVAVHVGPGGALYPAFYEPQPSVHGASSYALVCLEEVKLPESELVSCVSCIFV